MDPSKNTSKNKLRLLRSAPTNAAEPVGIASSPRLAWYEWYPSDFLGETRGWPLIARAIYRELLDAQWDMGALPRDAKALELLVPGVTHREWQTAWPYIAPKFPIVGNGRQNATLEARRRKAHELRQRRQEAGRRGATSLWNARRHETPNASPSDGKRMPLPSTSDGKAYGLHHHRHRRRDHTEEVEAQGPPPVVDPRGAGR